MGSAVRDATSVGGVVYAVGAANANNPAAAQQLDTPVLWSSTAPGTLVELPAGAAGFSNGAAGLQFSAYALTPTSAAYIASQARFSSTATGTRWVRVTRSLIPSPSDNLDISAVAGIPVAFAALAISDSGDVLYGQGTNADGTRTPRRYDAGATDPVTVIDVSSTGKTWGFPIPRGTSTDGPVDGLIMVGAASTPAFTGTTTSGGPFGYPIFGTNSRGFRYVYDPLTPTTTPLPHATSSGTWSFPIALSADGALTVAAGDSAEYPNGEVYFIDAANNVTTVGSPNTAMAPRLLGGMTEDGAVVVTFAGDAATGPGQIGGLGLPIGVGGPTPRLPYLWNSQGWFLLATALVGQGLDLEALGWQPTSMAVTGVRTADGSDLVFGQGRRTTFDPDTGVFTNGALEGFVIVLPAGFLASFDVPVTAPSAAAQSNLGAWILTGAVNPGLVGTILPDGRFVSFTQGTGAYQNGFEVGSTTWAGNGTELLPTVRLDTNGAFGTHSSSAVVGRIMTVTGDTRTIANSHCAPGSVAPACIATNTRIVGAPGSIVGAWQMTNPRQPGGLGVLVLLDAVNGSRYFLMSLGGLPGGDGFELGTHTWNSGALTLFPAVGPADPPIAATLTRDELGLIVDDSGSPLHFARVIDPAAVIPVFTGSLATPATTGVPFTFTVATRYAQTTSATNLPPGLSIDADTGEITGTPTATGSYDVLLTASNSFGLSSNATLTITVKSEQLALSVVAPPTATFGDSFTATVDGGSGNGSLSFLTSGACSNVAGDALITMTSGTGSCMITAEKDGDNEYYPATSPTVSVTAVKAAQSALSITGAPASAIYNQSFTLGATGGTTGGAVTFAATGACGNAGGLPLVTMTAGAGTCSLGATMAGNDNYDPVSAAPISVGANTATSSTTLAAIPGSSSPGQPVTFTATIAPQLGGAVTGSVSFRRGGTTLGTSSVSAGIAELVLTSLGVGTHVVSAIYNGDANVTGSTSSSVTVTVVAPSAPTTTSLTSSLNPSIVGQLVTLTATVTSTAGGTPTGTITFKQGPDPVATVPMSGGQASYPTSALPQGTTGVTAVYSGDSQFVASTSSSLTQQVNKAATTTTLSSNLNPSNGGQLVTFTATVTSPTPGTMAGSVTFRRGSTVLATVPLSGAQAMYATSTLPTGSSGITAIYTGDAVFLTSTSATLTQQVNQGVTTTVLISGPNPSVVGNLVTFTATITSSTGVVPTGTVNFKEGGTILATVAIDASGVATFSTSTLSRGRHNIRAQYGGDAYNGGSTSNTLAQTVQ